MRAHWHLLLLFAPFIFAAIAGEIIWYVFVQKRAYPWREMAASAGVFILRIPAKFLSALVAAPVAFFVWSHRLATVPLDTSWGLALLFVGEEFAYYWMHRAGHEIRWLWASHMAHHTPEQIHLASAFRLGATEILSGNWLFFLPLYLLGLNPVAVGATLALNLFYQFWLHTDLVGRLGPLEWVFNTPSHHRVHHASNAEYLDRNFGGVLIIWDRLFGTFAEERPETRIIYGLTRPIGSRNPLKIIFGEWIAMVRDVAQARTWRQRLAQIFGRPGDGFANGALSPENARADTP